jgi:hypothetical protein
VAARNNHKLSITTFIVPTCNSTPIISHTHQKNIVKNTVNISLTSSRYTQTSLRTFFPSLHTPKPHSPLHTQQPNTPQKQPVQQNQALSSTVTPLRLPFSPQAPVINLSKQKKITKYFQRLPKPISLPPLVRPVTSFTRPFNKREVRRKTLPTHYRSL